LYGFFSFSFILSFLVVNGERGITYTEFTTILGRSGGFQPPGTFEDFVKGFRVFDNEGTNYISAGELRYGKERRKE
jgi:Ca2+-binding EF-hand superfamily protein